MACPGGLYDFDMVAKSALGGCTWLLLWESDRYPRMRFDANLRCSAVLESRICILTINVFWNSFAVCCHTFAKFGLKRICFLWAACEEIEFHLLGLMNYFSLLLNCVEVILLHLGHQNMRHQYLVRCLDLKLYLFDRRLLYLFPLRRNIGSRALPAA